MRSAVVIAIDELAHSVIEVRPPEDDEVIDRFLLQALNPSLDEGVQVGCPS
jgi:hypothetical protein